jgi:hypothetical protein
LVGRTPYEAWVRYVTPLREALRCLTPGRFVLRESPAGIRANTEYSVALNNMNSVPLKGPSRIFLIAGQTVRIHDSHSTNPHERYRVIPLSYTYGFSIGKGRGEHELLTFHWNAEGNPSNIIPNAHLHIGPGLLAAPTVVRPRDFHNAHVPTGYITFAAVVRFAIAELGVIPQNRDWVSVLWNSETLLRRQYTP